VWDDRRPGYSRLERSAPFCYCFYCERTDRSRASLTHWDLSAAVRELGDESQMRVTMIVTGFPSADDPVSGIFNLRSAQGLSRIAKVRVVHLRSWLPSRAWSLLSEVEGISVCTLAIPQLPMFRRRNVELYRRLAWPSLETILRDSDLIHSVGGSFAGVVAVNWAQLAGVHHVMQITSEIELASNARRPTNEEMKHIHAIACNSAALASQFLVLYPTAPNVRAVYRGVDLQRFSPGLQACSQQDECRFLFLGGFPEYPTLPHRRNTKGGETLLAAWLAAEKELPSSASLTIAGPQSTSPDVLRWRAGLRRPERVHLLGAISPDAVPTHIRESDAVLVPSLQEGLPNVVLEAAACGRAVLASNLWGTAEIVVESQTGVLLPAGDADAWRSALIRFSLNRACLLTMGRNARQRTELFFDSNKYPMQMVDLYAAAIREPLMIARIS